MLQHGRHANIQRMSMFSDPLACQACPRLAEHLAQLRVRYPEWHARPVPSFGSLNSEFLVLGLAPGEKGANRTGRPFSGDVAGELLYPALRKFGFASLDKPLDEKGNAASGMVLSNCRITNAVRCLPPENKPTGAEIRACNAHLCAELAAMPNLKVVLALGTIAHQALLRARGLRPAQYTFGHDVAHTLPGGLLLVDSYHCSGYNWRTGRLSRESFEAVFERVRNALSTNSCHQTVQ